MNSAGISRQPSLVKEHLKPVGVGTVACLFKHQVSECINHLPCGEGLVEFTVVLPNLFSEALQDIDQLKPHLLDCFVGCGVNLYLGLFSCSGLVHGACRIEVVRLYFFGCFLCSAQRAWLPTGNTVQVGFALLLRSVSGRESIEEK